MLTIHTDGSCSGAHGKPPNVGGWAWVCLEAGTSDSGFHHPTTNQRMELLAAYEAVYSNPGEVLVVSDSSYVVNCFVKNWHLGWKKNGWVSSQKKPVANRDIWEPLIDLVLARGDVTFQWVKGHSGDPGNEAADLLATTTQRALRDSLRSRPAP